jgi:C4-dicarboxylate-specific signal transduction histidine kinase
MVRIEHALSRLNPRLEGLMSEVICKEGVGPLEVGRSAGRLEQVLSELVDGYLDAKTSHADAESVEARALILGL